ncbi:MAG TPA: DUF2911 domain-containing protein [Gemmatimonadaceae bacterium]|nr:DUF2911 domain-containing protein [Gemmatimonadaceae bacterium]
MLLTLIRGATLSALVASSAPCAQTGGFVITLGTDTVQVERFTRAADRISGTVVTHAPETRVVSYTLTLNADGTPARYEYVTTKGDGTPLRGNGQAGSIVFAADSLTRETLRNGEMVRDRIVARPGILPGPSLPYIGTTALLYELGFQYARKAANAAGESGLPQVFLIAGANQPSRTPLWFIGADSVEMDYFGVARRGFRLDAQGRLLRGDWGASTYKYTFARVPDVDVPKIAAAWSARDARGAAMGAMSPLDSVHANVAGAAVTIAYSRPAKRGRVVWGALVPWNAVWRFGADGATHLTTSADLMFGETRVPAGRYTLWMLPLEGGASQLVVSRKVDIFGTAYTPANDFARIPLERSQLAPGVERFTLALESGKFWIRWDDAAYSIPVALAPAQVRAPRTIEVPRDFRTIQQAIDSSRRGDTVLVAPGRYYENIRFRGHGTLVTSRFATSHDVADIERTIIDGSRPAHPDTASVVMFINQEDSMSVLQGFTLTGGKGTVWLDAKDHVQFREGGGILCELASPVIRFNYIQDNDATETRAGLESAGGGGIRCGYAEPTIANNVIRRNRGRYGAGVVLFLCAATVRNNLIVDNTGGEDFGGAGLWIVAPLSRRIGNLVEFNTIANNRSGNVGAAQPRPMSGIAGGVVVQGVITEFRNNIVWGNVQASGDQFVAPPAAPLTLGRNLVQGNFSAPPRAGGETLRADPQFVDTVRFELAASSPARASGSQLGAYGGAGGAPLIRK